MALHMSKGDGENSYNQNSRTQKYLQDEAMLPFLSEPLASLRLPAEPHSPVVVADLGCSSGTNAIALVSEIIDEIKSVHGKNSLAFHALFNDLPTNDFNTLFQLLTSPEVKRSEFFAAGVPGSFYGSLFPPSSVHVFVSTTALHFLSKVPSSAMDENSPAFNKTGWFVNGALAGGASVKAFRAQFAEDFDVFLRHRAKELVPGGVMLLGICSSWDAAELNGTASGKLEAFLRAQGHFNAILRELAQEGVVTEDHINLYNFPVFLPEFRDVKELVHKHDSELEAIAVKQIDVKPFVANTDGSSSQVVKAVVEMYRGASMDLITHQIGKQAGDLFLERFERRVSANVEAMQGESPIMFLALRRKD